MSGGRADRDIMAGDGVASTKAAIVSDQTGWPPRWRGKADRGIPAAGHGEQSHSIRRTSPSAVRTSTALHALAAMGIRDHGAGQIIDVAPGGP